MVINQIISPALGIGPRLLGAITLTILTTNLQEWFGIKYKCFIRYTFSTRHFLIKQTDF